MLVQDCSKTLGFNASSKEDENRETAIVEASVELRKVSTLVAEDKYELTRLEKNSGFLYLYNNKLSNNPPEAAWISIIASTLFPSMVQKKVNFNELRKSGAFNSFFKVWKELGTHKLLSVKKDLLVGKNFTVEIPIYSAREPLVLESILNKFKADPDFSLSPDSTLRVPQGDYPLNFSGAASVSSNDINALTSCKALLVSELTSSGMIVFKLRLEVSKREAEYLTNLDFLQMRPLDLFGPLSEWVRGYYGKFSRSPQFSMPLSKIAKEVEGNGTPRLSPEGMLVDEHSSLLLMPVAINQISRFEQSMADHYVRKDGSISGLPNEGFTNPPSAPVLMDWVNLKFAYTSLEGRLLVKNLDRSIVATDRHYLLFLKMKLDSDLVKAWISFVCRMSTKLGINPLNIEEASVALTGINLARERHEAVSLADVTVQDLWDMASPGLNSAGGPSAASQIAVAFQTLCAKLDDFITSSPDNAYAQYSVITVLSNHSSLRVFNTMAAKYQEMLLRDSTARSVYLTQGVKKDYVEDPIPYIADGVGRLPHQSKVANIMRESPKNAILPVDAGGGKSMLAITDILKEMKTKKGPFLIVCPSHLVPQYTTEFVYFTSGRINCIPVTNYTIRRHGFDRLEEMIKNAPPNTVVVTDFLAVLFKRKILSYGVAPVMVAPCVEFLRKFAFQYVFVDESHQLRNGTSRQQAVNRLIADIPYKRLASGTFVSNTLLDMVKQIALLDPTILGTVNNFIDTHALEVNGNKVLRWKPGAESAVRAAISNNVVIAEARRKEWAAILPKPVERFHKVELTPAQRDVYNSVLNEAVLKIQEEATRNEPLRLLMQGKEVDEEGNEVDSDSEIGIDALLKPYLSRLEQFLNAPARDILGNSMLTGADRISGKALKCVELCAKYLADPKFVSKIIIFTNYTASAEEIYEAFPPDLRSQAILYTAAEKVEAGAEFEKNPRKRILVGVENSMNTGLNLQHGAALIRVECVWTPGILEQGNSRIGRPNVKSKEVRNEIFYDWLIVDRTIDITKISYLMAKTISKAKFDEAGNTRFDELNVPALFPMKIETIQENNDFDSTLKNYFEDYQAYKQAVFAEYAEYRDLNKTTLFNEDGSLKILPLVRSENLAGAKLIARVPYVPGTELYKAEDLGLVRYDAFMRLNIEESQEDEEEGRDDSDADLDAAKLAALEEERAAVKGLWVHTDHGDGEILKANRLFLIVRLKDGTKIRVRKLAAFVMTRANTSNKDIRTQLLKRVGDLPAEYPIQVKDTRLKPRVVVPKEESVEETVNLTLEVYVVNDFLGLRVVNTENEAAVRVAQSLGFKYSPEYVAALIPSAAHMLKLFQGWKDAGFTVDKNNSSVCKRAYDSFLKRGRKASVNLFGVAASQDIKNFYRTEFKANPDLSHINPYPVIENNELYIAMPKRGQPGTMKAIAKVKVPSVKWQLFSADTELVAFTPSKEKALKVLNTFVKAGVVVTDLKLLVKQINRMRVARDI